MTSRPLLPVPLLTAWMALLFPWTGWGEPDWDRPSGPMA